MAMDKALEDKLVDELSEAIREVFRRNGIRSSATVALSARGTRSAPDKSQLSPDA